MFFIMTNLFKITIVVIFWRFIFADEPSQNDCQSIANQINVNLNNTPFIFTPITNQTCVNNFYNSSHQLRVTWENPGYILRVIFNGCLINNGYFIMRYNDNSTSYTNYFENNCPLQIHFNTLYLKEQVFDIYSIMPNPNLTNLSFFNGNIVFDFIKDCDCFNKNLTQVINVGDNTTSFALYQGSVSRYCEANSLCEHFRISYPGFEQSWLMMNLIFEGCMPDDQSMYIWTSNNLGNNSQNLLDSFNNSCDLYNRYHWASPNPSYIYSLTNEKLDNSDHKMKLTISFEEGLKDIGLKSITYEYANQVRIRHWVLCTVNTFSLILASYLIIKKSKKEMESMKWFLLNIAIWAYLVDFNLNVLFIPLPLFPAPSICSLGLISADMVPALGQFINFVLNPYVIWFITLGGTGSAISCAVYYRYKQLLNKSFASIETKRWIIPMAILHFISFLPLMIPLVLALYNKRDAIDANESLTVGFTYAWEVTTMFPCVTLNFYSVSFYIFLGVASLEILTYTIFILGVQIYILSHSLKIMKKYKHQKSHRLQRQLIVSIFLQSTIPLVCLILPYLIMIGTIILGLTNVVQIIEWIFEFSTLHSCFNTLAMIASISSYRKAFWDMFRLKKYNCYRESAQTARLQQYELKAQWDHGHYNRSVRKISDQMLDRTASTSDSPGDMNVVPPGRFQVLDVDKDVSIKDLAEAHGVTFKKGRGFYEFNKPETIQKYKEIIAMDKKNGDIFEGSHARTLLGLPTNEDVKIKPADYEYIFFIQSTSYNRKLIGGTKFLYEVDEY